jgi:hypothetical protein
VGDEAAVTWEQTLRDVLVILAVAIASGKAGWWAHATREERRQKRMIHRAEAGIAAMEIDFGGTLTHEDMDAIEERVLGKPLGRDFWLRW